MIKIAFDPNKADGPTLTYETNCKTGNELIDQFAFMVAGAIHYIGEDLGKKNPDIGFPTLIMAAILDALDVIQDHADDLEVSEHG